MWIAMNDSFVSIVQDRKDKKMVVVRARVKEDLESLFPNHQEDIIETSTSDYRFRLFLDKSYVSHVIRYRILDIRYENFKDSVKQPWRKNVYMKIWRAMYDVQEHMYGIGQWWQNYR